MLIPNRDPQDVVGLYAGEDRGEKALNIHKDIACFYSPVFKAAFNSQFIEGEEQKYRLEDASPRAVRLLIHVSLPPGESGSSKQRILNIGSGFIIKSLISERLKAARRA